MFVSIEDSIKQITELKEQIRQKESRVNHILKEAIDEHLRKGEKYYCIEDNKSYYPVWNFFPDPFYKDILKVNGVSLYDSTINVLCYPAKKDGSRSIIGAVMIDITKLIY